MTPKLNISQSGKTKEWGENIMKYYKGYGVISTSMKKEMEVLYKLANGEFNEKDYEYVLTPYGEEQRSRKDLKGDPAKLRNYDIIGPVLKSYLGDYIARGTKFQVVNPLYDIEEVRQAEEQRIMLENLKAQFRQEMEEANGVSTELDNTQVPPEEIKQKLSKLPNTDSIEGQLALDYIRYYNKIDSKYRLGFFDYISIGRIFTYRDGFKNETEFEITNPLDFNYVASQDCTFVEDGEAAWSEFRLNTAEIIDRYDSILTKEARDYVENIPGGTAGSETSYGRALNDMIGEAFNELVSNLAGRTNPVTSGFMVTHMTWKARRKLGKLMQYDPIGRPAGYIEVDEDFIPRKGEIVEWGWANEVWEGYCIDDKYYFGIRVLPLQRGSLGVNKAKLPYNGRTFGNRTSIPATPVKVGKYFQELHNIVKYRAERTLAKNKDRIMPIPLGLINDKKMDMFSTMFYSDYHGYLYYDETNKNAVAAMSAIRPIDGSMTQYIKAMYDISYSIRQEYYEVIGIPRQKLADIKASDDVGNTQEAINQGNSIIEELMVSFEELQERDYQCLLDYSKYVWVDGKKVAFPDMEGQIRTLNVDESAYIHKPYVVFVKGTKEERRKLEQLRAQVQPFAQNGYGPTAIGTIIASNNFEDLMQKLDYFERKLAEETQAAQNAKIQSDQQIAAEDRAFEQQKLDSDNYNRQEDRLNERVITAMKNQATLAALIAGDEGEKSPEIDTMFSTINKELADVNLKREELALKDKAIEADKFIAVENKGKYDSKGKK